MSSTTSPIPKALSSATGSDDACQCLPPAYDYHIPGNVRFDSYGQQSKVSTSPEVRKFGMLQRISSKASVVLRKMASRFDRASARQNGQESVLWKEHRGPWETAEVNFTPAKPDIEPARLSATSAQACLWTAVWFSLRILETRDDGDIYNRTRRYNGPDAPPDDDHEIGYARGIVTAVMIKARTTMRAARTASEAAEAAAVHACMEHVTGTERYEDAVTAAARCQEVVNCITTLRQLLAEMELAVDELKELSAIAEPE
ncbi:hypothetical protein BJ508DRAFT_311699 [Ascobolus immersus RN42]|uniref:Uncharacterized protein n=1 Tax=Ascobolus immersus RN42 TaxID=1160509 RepID=A0A3N4HQ11_ASCIM|nr:hypothetical protein BJ508DRAFT_311699 [Ascobolus immersus RN42]